MFSLMLKEIASHKMRMLGTAFAVLLGVAFMAGTLVLADTLTATFDSVVAEANHGVDARVEARSTIERSLETAGPRLDATVADVVAKVPGVERVAPFVTGFAQLMGPDGRAVAGEDAAAIGSNWIDAADINPFQLQRGRAPAGDDEIVIDAADSGSTGYGPGDRATVVTKAGAEEFTVVGVAGFGRADSRAGSSSVLFTGAAAQRLLSEPGRVDGISVTAADDVSQTELVGRIGKVLPKDLAAVTGDEIVAREQASTEDSVGPFKVFMLMFAVVAVFVGAFVINNTFSITFAQRTRQLAMLRSLGASRRQVTGSMLGEAAVVGSLAAAAGVAAGIGVAAGLQSLLVAMGVPLPDGSVVVHASALLMPFAMGVAVTVASAVAPARRAGRIRPVAALRELDVDTSATSRGRAVTGGIVTATGVALVVVGLRRSDIAMVGPGALAVFVGLTVLGPVLVSPVVRAVGFVLRPLGLPAEIGTRNALRNPTRTSRTASSLLIGVALVGFITVVAASTRTSFAGSLEDQFRGTHIVNAAGFDTGGGLSTDLVSALRDTPGVRRVAESRAVGAVVDGSPSDLFAFSASSIGSLFDLGTVEGDVAHLGSDGVAVAADHAAARHWTLGSRVPVTFAGGQTRLVVRALYDSSTEWMGDLFVDVSALDRFAPGQLDRRLYVDAEDSAVRGVVASYPGAEALDRAAFLAEVNKDVDQMLGIVYALLVLAVVIALLGIANTLALSVFERGREIGLLRAVGMERRQVRSAIRWEATIIAVFGTAMGLAIGVFLGWATVQALASEGIDTLTIPVVSLTVITVVAGAAGALAASAPARRAARMDVLGAISAP